MLKRHTIYKNCAEDSQFIKYFWDVLKNATDNVKTRFLQFASASGRLPPSDEEFKARGTRMQLQPLALRPGSDPDKAFPRAETCFFNVSLPRYTSKESAEKSISLALQLDWGMSGDEPDELLRTHLPLEAGEALQRGGNEMYTVILQRRERIERAPETTGSVVRLLSLLLQDPRNSEARRLNEGDEERRGERREDNEDLARQR
ncbi:hypothetical protein MHBO_004877 [Bonamia ostreae]|uniref:HECT-type E3 ubiquitin transferase n=1 Tax=Bonamia ostreae TaxID=126728 RepID=A0ABV2AUJ7_9EUKA